MRGETPEFPRAALEGRAQLTRMAAALRALARQHGQGALVSTEENPAVVFDRAAEKVCRAALCELCWQKEYTGTFNALNDATPFPAGAGRALPRTFPSYFADRCIHLPDFFHRRQWGVLCIPAAAAVPAAAGGDPPQRQGPVRPAQ